MQFFKFHARPHMGAKIIEVHASAGNTPDSRNHLPIGTMHMELHEWQALKQLIVAGMRNMRHNTCGVEIEDGTMPKNVM